MCMPLLFSCITDSVQSEYFLMCYDMLFVSAEPHPSNVERHSQKTVRVLFYDRRHQQLRITQQRYLVTLKIFT